MGAWADGAWAPGAWATGSWDGMGGGGGVSSSVTVKLVDTADNPRPNLTNLKWALFAQPTPNLFTAPVDQGAVESTDAFGFLTIDAAVAPGVYWLDVTNSTGIPGELPRHKFFGGPVTLT